MKKLSILITLFISISICCNAQVPKLQSIFIYNFTKYIEWPASYTSGNFIIGVLGQSPLTKELNNLSKTKKVLNQPIVINKFKNISTLIITEKKGMAKQGAGINFVIVNNKQKFELNKANISKYNLKVSPNLINLAILVQ